MGNAFAAVALEPDASFHHGSSFFFGLGLVVQRRVVQSTGYGIDDGFQQPDQRRKLRIVQSVN
jgi:hypothetical protein